MPYPGYYLDGDKESDCLIVRRGAQNSRVILDGNEKVVPSNLVRRADDTVRNHAELILPTVPLESLYRHQRKSTGSKEYKFESVRSTLVGRHGAVDEEFLTELFRRSVSHASFYRNVDEAFCPDRLATRTKSDYAKDLVQALGTKTTFKVYEETFKFVDFEVFPFRTTYSCNERGGAATSSGSGGMDVLLCAGAEKRRPVIGEIKANTETVGPTFALIQSLMYASQIATKNQFERLAKHYPETFADIDANKPIVEILIIVQSFKECVAQDLAFAKSLAASVCQKIADHVSEIRFAQCTLDRDGDIVVTEA